MTLIEDHGAGETGDVTSRALVPPDRQARGRFLVKGDGVLAGINLAPIVFAMAEELVCAHAQDRADEMREAGEAARAGQGSWKTVERLADQSVNAAIQTKVFIKDGTKVRAGDVAAEVTGNARAMLFGERTALNLLCHLSGVATMTARFAEKCAGTRAKIVDTRKTTPLWRDLEKYAVKCGGGVNHRIGLYDMVLIKDNHLALWGANDPAEAVRTARARYPKLPIEVEVTDLGGLAKVCRGGAPQYVLLDNFDVPRLKQAVEWTDEYYKTRPGRPLLEASGGVNLETVQGIAQTGVDRISVGALTHSVRVLDVSLEIEA
ncbi:MAG: carboxylating nicotinate-nucleotide diphosphorylase [Planctomycetota bacterium]|nr:carboxylating nicotinate-nucleotide diphosphorylase [Planctomycetota bacterium]